MSISRAKLLSRIKKCLALGQSSNSNEAAAALRKASELMAAYQVDVTELALADVSECRSKVSRELINPPAWMGFLGQVVADAFGCRVYWALNGFAFVGTGAAPEIADYTITVLRRQLVRQRAEYFKRLRGKRSNRIRRADAYAMGWVYAVSKNVEAFARPVPAVVNTFMELRHPNLLPITRRNRKGTLEARHVVAGIADGSKVELQHGVGGTSRTLHLKG
jgi:hypothetical protein